MQTYCVSCHKNTGNIDAKVIKTKNGRLQMRYIRSVCRNKKYRFVSNDQKGHGLLSSLGIRTPLSKIPGLNILFKL